MSANEKSERRLPILTVDAVIISLSESAGLNVLLIERKWGLFAGMMALPGGIVDYPETAEQAVKRELEEETSVTLDNFIQLKTFSDPQRDAEKYSVSVAFLALVRSWEHKVKGGDDALSARWAPVSALPKLAFDHDRIVATAKKRLQHLAYLGIIGCDLLPAQFSLHALHALHQNLAHAPLDPDNFYRKFVEAGLLSEAGSGLYKFDKAACAVLFESAAP